MGVGSSQVEFDGDAGKILSEMRKINDAQKRLEGNAKQLAEISKKGSEEAQRAYEKELVAAFKLEQKKKDLRRELEELTKAQQKHNQSFGAWADSASAKIGLVASGLGAGVLVALMKIGSAQAAWNDKLSDTVRKQDEIGRKLQVQAMLKDEDFQKVLRTRIAPIAKDLAVPLPQAQPVATELISHGFSTEDATGGGLREILAGAQGTNAADKTQFATAMAGFLRSQGKKLTGENVRGVTEPLAALFKETPFQGGDLAEIAKIGALLGEFKMSQSEILATITVLKQTQGTVAESATKGRNVIGLLAGAGGSKEHTDMLTKLGGEGFAAKVDPARVGIRQALTNLGGALAGETDDSKNAFLAKFFGQESVGAAAQLLKPKSIAEIAEFQRKQMDRSVLPGAVGIATQGPAAAATRAGIEAEMHQLATGNTAARNQLVNEIAEQVQREQGGITGTEIMVGAGGAGRRVMGAFGADMEAKFRDQAGQGNPLATEVIRRFDEYKQGAALPAMPAGDAIKIAPITAPSRGGGPLRRTNWTGDEPKLPTAEELELDHARNAAARGRIAAQEGKLAAELPGSDWSTRISPTEQKKIDALERAAKSLEIAAEKLEAAQKEKKTQDKEEKLKKTAPAANRNAQT